MSKIIQIDTREKPEAIKHIIGYFNAIRQPFIRSKLYTGDYTLINGQSVVIERKANVLELAGNLGKQHARFKQEILRAKEIGVKFVVLIEEPLSLEDIPKWTSPRSKFSGKVLYKIMNTITQKYGVEWRFCCQKDTAKIIIDILRKEIFQYE